jgi:hypothetical protein
VAPKLLQLEKVVWKGKKEIVLVIFCLQNNEPR